MGDNYIYDKPNNKTDVFGISVVVFFVCLILVVVYAAIDAYNYKKGSCKSTKEKYTADYNNMFKTGVVDYEVLKNYNSNEVKCYSQLTDIKDIMIVT